MESLSFENTFPSPPSSLLLSCPPSKPIKEYILQPDNFIIPDNMIHNISHQEALLKGISRHHVFHSFLHDASTCSRIVSHNARFDVPILLNELFRCNLNRQAMQMIQQLDIFCTMKAASLALKGKSNGRISLADSYHALYGQEIVNAHNAGVDVAHTERVYNRMLHMGFADNMQEKADWAQL